MLWIDLRYCISVRLQASAAEDGGFSQCLMAAHDFFKTTQIPENPPEYKRFYRQMNKVHVEK